MPQCVLDKSFLIYIHLLVKAGITWAIASIKWMKNALKVSNFIFLYVTLNMYVKYSIFLFKIHIIISVLEFEDANKCHPQGKG